MQRKVWEICKKRFIIQSSYWRLPICCQKIQATGRKPYLLEREHLPTPALQLFMVIFVPRKYLDQAHLRIFIIFYCSTVQVSQILLTNRLNVIFTFKMGDVNGMLIVVCRYHI